MKFKKLIALALAGALMVSVAACGKSEPAKKDGEAAKNSSVQTVEAGKLLVAMEAQYPPFNWTQTNDSNGAVPIKGTPTFANGYDVQIAKKVAESMGLQMEVVKLPWDSLSPAVQNNVADVVMAGMSPTAERRQAADFSDPYYLSQLVVVVKKDGSFANAKTFADFKGAKITAQVNTFHAKAMKQMTDANVQEPMKDFSAMRESLRAGIIDGYVSEKVEGLSASAALKDFAFVEFAEDKGFKTDKNDVAIAAAIRKGNADLLKEVNAALAKISDADRDSIMDKAIKEQPIAG